MKKNKNNEIYIDYFGYFSPQILVKYLYKLNQDEKNKLVCLVNVPMIDLKSSVNKKKFPKNNSDKIIDIVEKIIDFNKQQKIIGLKRLTPKQMLQRLLIALAQIIHQLGNTLEKLLSGIRQVTYYLHQAKEITKKVYNNIMNSIKLQYKMDIIFMNSENSKTSNPHRLLLNLSDEIILKRSDKYFDLSNLTI